MSDLQAMRSGCAAVRGVHVGVLLQGADSADFLNRLLTVDTRALPADAVQPAFLLDAKGRIQCAMVLTRADDGFRAWVAPPDAERLPGQLDFFHFGERFECTVEGALPTTLVGPESGAVLAALGRPAPPPGCHAAGVVHLPGWPIPVYHVGDLEPAQAEAAGATAGTLAGFEALRVALGVPGPAELDAAYTPLDVGQLSGVTEGKGCYPGQEVIERTLAIGRPANKRARLALSGPTEPGPLTLDGAPAGTLTSVAQVDGAWVGVGVLKQKRATVGATLLRDGAQADILEVFELRPPQEAD